MSLNILTTPNKIYQTVTEIYPSAEVEIEETDPIKVKLSLSNQLPPLTVCQAIDRNKFIYFLNQMQLDSIGQQIDNKRFSVDQPLTDWQKFRRVMYEREGRKCADAIIEFIQNPSSQTHEVLLSLGLAPEQLQEECTDKDRKYLYLACNDVNNLPAEEKESFLKSLNEQYPKMNSLVPFQDNPARTWPNVHSLFTFVKVLNSVGYLAFPSPYLLVTNIVCRSLSLLVDLYKEQPTKGLFDIFGVVSVAAIPYGNYFAIGSDFFSEGSNYYGYSVSLAKVKVLFQRFFTTTPTNSKKRIDIPSRLDPTIRENACEILNITEDQIEDRDFVYERYQYLRDQHVKRQANVSRILANTFQDLIDDLDQAWKTLYPGG